MSSCSLRPRHRLMLRRSPLSLRHLVGYSCGCFLICASVSAVVGFASMISSGMDRMFRLKRDVVQTPDRVAFPWWTTPPL